VVAGETLLCGIWLNGLANIPYVMLQAQGRPDVVAKIHLAEIGPYVALLWYSLHQFGLEGAAFAYSTRVAVDAILLIWGAKLGLEVVKRLIPGAALVFCAWLCVRLIPTTFESGRIAAGALLVIASGVWSLQSSARLRQEMTKVLRYVNVS
jgi:O-antigen/teichoic acid export membrane protein